MFLPAQGLLRAGADSDLRSLCYVKQAGQSPKPRPLPTSGSKVELRKLCRTLKPTHARIASCASAPADRISAPVSGCGAETTEYACLFGNSGKVWRRRSWPLG